MLAVLERRYLALCAPAQLYMALGAMGAIGSAFQSPTGAIAGLGLTVAWSAMLNLVCQSGYPTLAWGLVFAPSLLIAALLVAGIVFLTTLPSHGERTGGVVSAITARHDKRREGMILPIKVLGPW